MRTLALLASLTILAMAFAGCTGDDGGGEGTTSTSSSSSRTSSTATGTSSPSSTSGSATSTSTGSTPQNQGPSGSISVTVNGTNATFSLTGSDPDGDTLVWDLTFGDGASTNGTQLPANVTHAYAAGNFTANFTVTDGQAPSTYDVEVTVVGGGAAGPQAVEGDWTVGTLGCSQITAGEPYSEWRAEFDELNGVAFVKFDVDPATIGKPFSMAATMAGAGGYAEIDFYNSGNTIIEYFPPTPIAPGTVTATGNVPDGSVFAVMFPCHPAPGTFNYSAG